LAIVRNSQKKPNLRLKLPVWDLAMNEEKVC